jgi:hypothetical protein
MTCRKRRDAIETELQSLARDEARGKPVDRPSDGRHEGVRESSAGSCVERGNLRLDAKGELQVVDP